MKPILYAPTETAFDTNGIGVLADAVSCSVRETLNGSYELALKYPIKGIHFSEIGQRSVILAEPDPDAEAQPFRVYRITKPMGGIVTVYARHTAYDLMGVVVSPFTAASVADALVQMKNHAVSDCPFTFATDKSTSGTMTVSVPTAIWTLLGGSEGSILDVYGGEYEFGRSEIYLHNRRGANRGVSIRYGKNLTTLEQDENCASCYTGVYPYWVGTDGQLVELPERIVNASGTYDYVRNLPLDLSTEWQEAPTEEQLRTRAEAYITANDIGVPKVSWKIEFVQLEQTEEYKHLGRLEQVLLGDTVTVIFPEMCVNATARVVETDYDPILERYNSITLGSVRANLAKTIAQQGKEIAKKPSLSTMERITMTLAYRILGAQGGAVRFLDTDGDEMPDTLYVADNPDPNQATKVWRWNYEGWAGSKNGYSGPFILGATLEDGILANAITAANLIAGTVQSADDGKTFFLNLDNSILRGDFTALSIKGKTVEQVAQESVDVGGTNLVPNSRLNQTGDGYYFARCDLIAKLEPGTQYTFTANGRTNDDKTSDDGKYLRVFLNTSDWSWEQSVSIPEIADTTRHITFVAPDDIAEKDIQVKAYYYPSEENSGVAPAGTATVNWVKLEKGNQSTDWSPAPEDLENYADTAAGNALNEIKTQEAIFNLLSDNGKYDGIWLQDGKLYFNLTYAKAGTLEATNITLSGKFAVYSGGTNSFLGGFTGYMSGAVDGVPTDGIAIANSAEDCYHIATDAGVRSQAGSYGTYVTKTGEAVIKAKTLMFNGGHVAPDMEAGVEYLTAEKFDGDPVYAKLIDCGLSADGATITLVSSGCRIVRCAVWLGKLLISQRAAGETSTSSTYYAKYYLTATNLTLYCGADEISKQTYALIFYTK